MSHDEAHGADLLERLLHAPDASVDELAADANERDELRALSAFVARCRRDRAALEDRVASASVVRAALERTTRDDPSLLGDLRLVRRFVGGRLATSPLLRFVAASLVLHLVALPVVAWYVLERADEVVPQFSIEHEPELEYPPAEPEDVQLDFVVDDVQAEADRLEGRTRETFAGRWSVDNALALDRFLLVDERSAGAPGSPGSSDEPALALLAARARVGGGPVVGPASGDGGPLERALWAELELDRFALGRPVASELRSVLDALAADAGAASDAVAGLIRHVRERARAYGLLPIEPGHYGRAWTLAARSGRGLGAGLGALVERRGGELEARRWRDLLRAALVERGLGDDPIARAWAPR